MMDADGVSVKVEASQSIDYYRGLPHMEPVGDFSFYDIDSGEYIGSATRYYQDCDEIMLLA